LKTVTLYIDASRTIEIVRDLRQQGLMQGKDFDFKFVSSAENTIEKGHAIFTFYNEKYATFFALKYSI